MLSFLSTALPPPERAAAYRQVLRRHFSYLTPDARAEVETDQPDCFNASLEPFTIGQLRGSIHRCNSAHRLFLPRTGARNLALYLLCGGDITLRGIDGTSELLPGDMIVWRMGMEWQATSNRFEMIGFGLPEPLLLHRELELRSVIGRRISGSSGLGACVLAFLRKAVESHRELAAEEASALGKALIDAICMLGASESTRGAAVASAEQEEKLERLKLLALRSLERTDLTPAAIAEQGGVSTRTLHRLFAVSGTTFQDWLRDRRLERCWTELNDHGGLDHNIAEIAFRYGFSNLSTFNRSFRARFGMTPRAARQSTQTEEV